MNSIHIGISFTMPHYGKEYEVEISKATAKKLLAYKQRELPKIGYEVELEFVHGYALRVINISGHLYLGCFNLKTEYWIKVFKFDPNILQFVDATA